MDRETLGGVIGATLAALIVVAGIGPASAAGQTTVSLAPESRTVEGGGTATFDVVVESADNGVGAYDFEVSVADPDIAVITDIELVGADPNGAITVVDFAGDNSSVAVRAPGSESDGVIASITVTGRASGSTDLGLSVNSLGDTENTNYGITSTRGASVEVSSNGASGTEPASDGEQSGDQAGTTQSPSTGATPSPAGPTQTEAGGPGFGAIVPVYVLTVLVLLSIKRSH